MFSVDLSTRECGGHVVVTLRGELDVADAASIAAALAAIAARTPEMISIWRAWSSSAPAAWRRWRAAQACPARRGDLLLAAPQHQVFRVLTLIRLIDVFPVHASVAEAVSSAGLRSQAAAP